MQIQDWSKATIFLGYDEVRAVKPLPPLGWRDQLDCILCHGGQQDRGVPDCHRRLENAIKIGRSPGELNRVAESNCALEPARQAGQLEPRLQMLCKRLQWHNRHTCGGAAKGSRGGWYRRRCVLRHPHRTPWVPNGTGQRCVGRNVAPEPYSGYWQNRSWARVRKQGVAHCRPMDLRTRRKRKLLFLEKVAEQKRKILLPALHWGKERRCSRRLLRKSKFQHLRVACVRAALSTSWTTWGLAGTLGCRSPARGSTRQPRYRFGLGRSSSEGCKRVPTATGRLRPGPGGSGGWCITPGCCCCTAENCWAKPSTVSPNSPAWEMGRQESVRCRRPSSLPG